MGIHLFYFGNKIIKQFDGNKNTLYYTTFSPVGRYIAASAGDKTFIIWDVDRGTKYKTFKGHNDIVSHLEFSPDGKYIASVSYDSEQIRIWDINSARCIKTFEGHSERITSILFTPDGEELISSSFDGTIKLWEFKPLQEIIDQTRERFKDVPLTAQERREYYIE